jgi:hypothetical protein
MSLVQSQGPSGLLFFGIDLWPKLLDFVETQQYFAVGLLDQDLLVVADQVLSGNSSLRLQSHPGSSTAYIAVKK